MRAGLRSPTLALVGLLAVGIVAVALLRGELSLTEAAVRALVVFAVLKAVEWLVLPLARSLVGGPANSGPARSDEEAEPARRP